MKKEITPTRLLYSQELKEYVDKHSPEDLKPYFERAFQKINELHRKKLLITATTVRGNIQTMLDYLDDKKMVSLFKNLYK